MLWEGGWEWARLTKSKYISIEVTCPPPPPPPPYLLLISILLPRPPYSLSIRRVPPPLSFSLSKVGVSFGAVLKKSKKRQAKTLLLKIRSTPIALAALPADFSIFSVPPLCQFSFEKPMIFWSLVQIFDILSKKTIDFHRFSLKSWSFLWKPNDLSRFLFKFVIFVWVIQICISETLNIHQNEPLPGHSWLQKCICEERLSIENVTFWAPCIFQKFRVPDLRLSDSIDSHLHLIAYPQTVCKGLQC